ncbi:VOC family protein [Sphingomonas sp. NPDC092331]|uniref:VOC family protein n=1 Tax=unclassified Sphingomonas TaxID=196159 RepID=UPI0031F52337
MSFPAACPEIPVSDLAAALDWYRTRLAFTIDWSDEALGLAGVSRGASRMFLSNAAYRAHLGNAPPLVLWLNLNGRAEVDALHAEWSERGVAIDAPPRAEPWKLYEFFAADPDGNRFRVFYDFAWEER